MGSAVGSIPANRRRRDLRRASAVGLAAVAISVGPLLAQTAPQSGSQPRYPHAFLQKHLGFTEKELRQTEQGRPVVKALETNLDREIAIFGIIWIEAEPDQFVSTVRDIERFERGAGVLGVRKIGEPPALADFAAMTLPADDLKALRTCKLGDCRVKVDEPALKRYQTEVDWSARDALAQANVLARELMLETVLKYQQGGNKSLGEMRDHRRPTFIGEEFAGMLANSPYLPEYLPALHDYLKDYPSGKPAGAEEFFYWSKVNFGLQDTVRVNHVVIYRNPNAPSDVAIASKMLYATHYFHTALEMRYVARDTARPDARGFYLMTLLRSRSDGMTGVFGGTIRRRAVKGSSEGLTKHLLAVKRSLEAAAREGV
jgi:hypothetical protein